MIDVQLPQAISRIVFRCSEQTKTELVTKMQIHEGSILTDELFQQARETSKRITSCSRFWLDRAYDRRSTSNLHPK